MLKALLLIFPALFVSLCASAQNKMSVAEAAKHMGEVVTICDKIYETEFVENSKTPVTILKMGSGFPMHKIDIVINFKDRKNFMNKPETYYLEKDVCLTGKVVGLKGKPQIIVSKPIEIQIGSE